MWFTSLDGSAGAGSTHNGRTLGRITPGGIVTQHDPGADQSGRPFDLIVGPDGALWFSDDARSVVGRYGAPPGTPSAPRNVTTVTTGTAVAFDFDPPEDLGTAETLSDTLTCTAPGATVVNQTGTQPPLVASGFDQGVTYECVVTAADADNDQLTSSPSVAVTVRIAPPGPPTDVTVTTDGTNVTFGFSPPSDPGSATTITYTVRCTSDDAATVTVSGAAAPLTVADLQSSTTYHCVITAADAEAPELVSGPSEQITLAVLAGGPSRPPANRAPVAVDDAASTDPGQPVTIHVLANDTDPDGDELTIAGITAPDHGTAQIDGDRIVYTPREGFVGSDRFSYTVSDGRGRSDTATVTITVRSSDSPGAERLLAACDDPPDRFDDDDGTTHEAAINCLAALGLLSGYADGTIGAGEAVTRGQIATLLLRAIETATGKGADELCPDGGDPAPDGGSTRGAAIACLHRLVIISGYPDGTFRPGQPVSRAQIASLLARTAGLLGIELPEGDPARFADVDPRTTHAEPIAALAAAGVLDGYDDGRFGPHDSPNRGQYASMLKALLDLLESQTTNSA